MRIASLSLAVAMAFPVAAQTDKTNWGVFVKIAGGVGLVKGVLDLVDWLKGKLLPNPQALWYCPPATCNFSAAGTPPTSADLEMAGSFIATLGKTWNKGEVITLCNGWTCLEFEHQGYGFDVVASYPDPNVGYTNRPRSDYGRIGGQGNYTPQTRAAYNPSFLPSTSGPQLRGSVTTICCEGISSGAGGGRGLLMGDLD